jgi:hypothetical protein
LACYLIFLFSYNFRGLDDFLYRDENSKGGNSN